MNLQASKWDHSLALRLPEEFVRRHGLQDGAMLQAEIGKDGALTLKPAGWDRAAFAAELDAARAALPPSRAALESLRGAS
jgi:antitoxin MazE